MKCPICNEIMVKIIYGLPGTDLLESAKQRKVFIGGCVVGECNPKYHCYKCQKSFYEDLDVASSVDEDDNWIQDN